jgi:membrane-bound metal-dependent hydrolase YbcI (DUF457 family)
MPYAFTLAFTVAFTVAFTIAFTIAFTDAFIVALTIAKMPTLWPFLSSHRNVDSPTPNPKISITLGCPYW